MKRWMGSLIVVVVLSGCASAYQSSAVFPTRGQTGSQVVADQLTCQDVASGKTQDAATAAVMGGAMGAGVGAMGGAAVGAVSGALGGGAGQGAIMGTAVGATIGAITGVIGGISASKDREKAIYAACMRSRGYEVGG